MLAALRSRAHSSIAHARSSRIHQTLGFPLPALFSSPYSSSRELGFLSLEEVQKVLNDVKADDVKVIPVRDQCDWTDFMVIATGRSAWHVENIAQALIYKFPIAKLGRIVIKYYKYNRVPIRRLPPLVRVPVESKLSEILNEEVLAIGYEYRHLEKVKQKQIGTEHRLLPSVEGSAGGNWIVVDSGPIIVHALDEKASAYYNLEGLWTKELSSKGPNQDLEKAIVKTRRKNNSKKPMLVLNVSV